MGDRTRLLVLLMCMDGSVSADAAEAILLGVTVEGVPERREPLPGFEVARLAQLETLARAISPTYRPGFSAVTSTIYIDGTQASTSFAQGTTRLNLSIPDLGIDLNFQGRTRRESRDLLLAYLAGRGESINTRLLRQPWRRHGGDPVAGNPTSLIALMGEQDLAVVAALESFDPYPDIEGDEGIFSIAGTYGGWHLGDNRKTGERTPLGYTFAFPAGYRLTVSSLLDRASDERDKYYAYDVGAALHVPIGTGWTLTPALRYGRAGSREDGGSADVVSGSLTHRIRGNFGAGYELGMSNQIAYYRSRTRDGGFYDVDYDLNNRALRNAFDIGGLLGNTLLGSGARWRAWVVDARYSGADLYCGTWQEYGLSVSTRVQTGKLVYDRFELGLKYTNGESDVQGLNLSFGYRF